jgi:hypothetical protein
MNGAPVLLWHYIGGAGDKIAGKSVCSSHNRFPAASLYIEQGTATIPLGQKEPPAIGGLISRTLCATFASVSTSLCLVVDVAFLLPAEDAGIGYRQMRFDIRHLAQHL